MNITELLDLLQSASWPLSSEISDELLEAGYVWEYSAACDCYRLTDLFGSGYFA